MIFQQCLCILLRMFKSWDEITIVLKYWRQETNKSGELENKAWLSGWAHWTVAEAVGMCGASMFLMKSTELHWSAGDESELSKAIRQVKDPLSAPCSSSERDTVGAQERAAAPPRAKCGGYAYMRLHFWCHCGAKERYKIQVPNIPELQYLLVKHKPRLEYTYMSVSIFCPSTYESGFSVKRFLPTQRQVYFATLLTQGTGSGLL